MTQAVDVAFAGQSVLQKLHENCPYDDLESLVLYLLEDSDPAREPALGAIPLLMARRDGIAPPFRARRLRRDMLILIITAKRAEIEMQLQYHASRLDDRLRGKILQLEQGALVHRLMLAMMLREGYAVRDCSLLLDTSDALVHSLYREAIHLL